jgi:hypothetical protein
VNWTGLAQDRKRWRALVNLVLNLMEPEGSIPNSQELTVVNSVLNLRVP